MTAVGAAAAEEQAAKLGRLRWMDGRKGGAYAIRSLLLLSWKKKTNEQKKSGGVVEWWSCGVSVVALLPSSTGATQCSAPNKLLSGTRTRAGTTTGACISICSHTANKSTTHNHPCSTTGRSFADAQTLYYSLPIEKWVCKKTRHDHDHHHVSSKKFVLQMFFNYHKTSEPNNNKINILSNKRK